jgi:hypothetical protein
MSALFVRSWLPPACTAKAVESHGHPEVRRTGVMSPSDQPNCLRESTHFQLRSHNRHYRAQQDGPTRRPRTAGRRVIPRRPPPALGPGRAALVAEASTLASASSWSRSRRSTRTRRPTLLPLNELGHVKRTWNPRSVLAASGVGRAERGQPRAPARPIPTHASDEDLGKDCRKQLRAPRRPAGSKA